MFGIVALCGVGSILALVFGYRARREIKQSGGGERGNGLALTGLVLGWIGIATMVVLVGVIVFLHPVKTYFIPSESNVPTLKVGDRVLTEKISYELHDPERGDMVIFDAPPSAATSQITELVKRVVGLPGETIEGRGGRIYIDGKPLDEPYLARGVRSRTFDAVKIPDDRYFMLGDDRQLSKDSTFFGPIERDAITSRVFFIFSPTSRIGGL